MTIPNSGYFYTNITGIKIQKSQYVGMLRLPNKMLF